MHCQLIPRSYDTNGVNRHDVCDFVTLLIFGEQGCVLRYKKVERCLWYKCCPFSRSEIIFSEPVILASYELLSIGCLFVCLTFSPQVGVTNSYLSSCLWMFNKDANGHALLNVEDIFIFRPIRTTLLLFAIPM